MPPAGGSSEGAQTALRGPAVLLAGIALGLCAALCFSLGLALQKRATLALPPGDGGGWRSSIARYFTNRAWVVSGLVIALGWILQFAALSFAPIGLVMPAVGAGVAFQAVLARRWFEERLTRFELAGITCSCLGIAIMAASLDPRGEGAGLHVEWPVLTAVLAGLALVAAVLRFAAWRRDSRTGSGEAGAAGLLYAGSGILAKALGIGALVRHEWLLAVGLLLLMLAYDATALVLLQVAHRRGRAVIVVPMMSVLADFVPAAMGPLLFAEPWPGGWHGGLRLVAFATIAGGILLLARGWRD